MNTQTTTKSWNLIRRSPALLVGLAVFVALASPVHAISRTAVVSETNRIRTSVQLRTLLRSTTLERAAVAKAENMFQQQYFGHSSPQGERFWVWLGSGRAKFTRLGENIARGYHSEKRLLADWMRSGGHRANILKSSYTHVGVGIRSGVLAGTRTTIVVEIFGAKRGTPLVSTATVASQ